MLHSPVGLPHRGPALYFSLREMVEVLRETVLIPNACISNDYDSLALGYMVQLDGLNEKKKK
jgi:hypothetical protein